MHVSRASAAAILQPLQGGVLMLFILVRDQKRAARSLQNPLNIATCQVTTSVVLRMQLLATTIYSDISYLHEYTNVLSASLRA